MQVEAGGLPAVLGAGDKPACGAAEYCEARWCSTFAGVGARLLLPSIMFQQCEGVLHSCMSS